MCGIVATSNTDHGIKFIIDSIKNLEYRGYDSWGVGGRNRYGGFSLNKRLGSITKEDIDYLIADYPANHNYGNIIGHTRWATSGLINTENAHPVIYDNVMVAMNGTIDNYKQVDEVAADIGRSDTYVLAHILNRLVGKYIYSNLNKHDPLRIPIDFASSLCSYLVNSLPNILVGEYSFVMVCRHRAIPELIGINMGRPLYASYQGDIASDSSVFSDKSHDKCIFIDKNQHVVSHRGKLLSYPFNKVDFQSFANRGNNECSLPHMHTEIMQQPKAIQDLNNVMVDSKQWDEFHREIMCQPRVHLVGCGSSYYAAKYGRYVLESAGIPAYAWHATELNFSAVDHNSDFVDSAIIAISQSGETKDVLSVVDKLKESGSDILWAITNKTFSSIVNKIGGRIINMNAGHEQGVAATKTFIATCYVLWLLSNDFDENPLDLSEYVEACVNRQIAANNLARKYKDYNHFLYFGSGANYPIAQEGALKLKEIAYVHAEAMPSSELKHGPIALIDDNVISLFIVGSDKRSKYVIQNMNEVKSRSGKIIAICTEYASKEAMDIADDHIVVPSLPHSCLGKHSQYLQAILNVVPLQWFAYYFAEARGLDVDKPRNLAKSVTV